MRELGSDREGKPEDGLRRAREGDSDALEELLFRHEQQLTRIAERGLGRDLKARMHVSDIVQSAAVDIVRDIGSFRGDDEDAFLAWAARIVQNKIRGKGRYFTAHQRQQREQSLETMEVTPAGPDRTPSSEARGAELQQRVAVALRELPDDYRRALLLRSVENLSAREIGDLLGRTEHATRMLLHRARAALAAQLAEHDE